MKKIYLQTVIAVPPDQQNKYEAAIAAFTELIKKYPEHLVRKIRFRNNENVKIKICIPVSADLADIDLVATLDNLVEAIA